MRTLAALGSAALAATLLTSPPAGAQWTADLATDVVVCDATNWLNSPAAVPDGAGGSVIAWLDGRNNTQHVYAQRLDANGIPQWTPNGVLVSDAAGSIDLDIASDGAGGVFLTWADNRTGGVAGFDIFAQHLDGDGVPQWDEDGSLVCSANWGQQAPTIVPDGAGGALVAWDDYRNSAYYIVYVQHLDANGARLWSSGGVTVSVLTAWNRHPQMLPDGAGNVIVAWETGDLRAAKMSMATGAHQWGSAGEVVATTMGSTFGWKIVPDGAGGFCVAYRKSDRLYAARMDSAGTPAWTDVPVNTVHDPYDVNAVEDGAGGIYAVWMDGRNGLPLEVYAQRVNAAGVPQWDTDGKLVERGSTDVPGACLDDAGGLLVGYQHTSGSVFKVQRIGADGVSAWPGGVELSQSANSYHEITLHTDGAGGAIAAYRIGALTEIHAERVDADGNLGLPVGAPVIAGGARGWSLVAWPNPFRASTMLRLAGAPRSSSGATIEVLDVVGRRVRSLPALPGGGDALEARWDGRDEGGRRVPAGIYFVRESRGGATGRLVRLR